LVNILLIDRRRKIHDEKWAVTLFPSSSRSRVVPFSLFAVRKFILHFDSYFISSPLYLHTRYIVFRIFEPHRVLTANGVRRGLKIINANYTWATGTLPVTALHGMKAAVRARVNERTPGRPSARHVSRCSCMSMCRSDYRLIQLIRSSDWLLSIARAGRLVLAPIFRPPYRPVPSRSVPSHLVSSRPFSSHPVPSLLVPVSFACSELYT